jgi:hypothetical protein
MRVRLLPRLTVVAVGVALTVGGIVTAQQSDQITVPFTDPARPGLVTVNSVNGTITVRAANRRDVLIETRLRQDRNRNRPNPGGLRRLDPTAGFEAVEENNRMTISTSANDSVELLVTVPTRTNVKAVGVNGGPLTIEGVDGEIEANNTNNAITLANVAGSVVAHSTNGNVKATVTRVAMDKPMAFTSFNGDVDVTLPASLKATFKLRSDMGDVLTDFDLQVKTDTATSQNPQRQNGQYRIVVNKSLTGTLNGGGPEIELRTFNGSVYLRKGQ